MSTKAVAVIHRWYEAVERGSQNMQDYLTMTDPNVSWQLAIGYPHGGTYVGQQAIWGENGFYAQLTQDFEIRAELCEIRSAGDEAVSLGVYHGRSKRTGRTFSAEYANFWAVRNGKITGLRQYTDTAQFWRAAEEGEQETTAELPTPDYSARDEVGRFSVVGLLKKKPGLTLAQFDTYWRDAHGMIVARLPGVWQNWQHHVALPDAEVWPRLPGIEYDCPAEDAFEGVSEATFAVAADQQRFITAPQLDLLMADEQNLFRHTILHAMDEGGSRTLVDRIADGAPNGRQDLTRFLIFLRPHPNVRRAEFYRYVSEQLAPVLAASEHVRKLRLHLLGEYQESDYPAAAVNVRHDQPVEKQYQALLEVVFPDRLAMRRLFESPAYAATTAEQPRYLQALHVFPVHDTYTLVYEGQLTLAGQRTSPVAELITRLGAFNQTQEQVMTLVTGSRVSTSAS